MFTESPSNPNFLASYPWLTYVWVISISALGGLVRYLQQFKQGRSGAFSLWELLGEIVTSAFVGILAFWLCKASGLDDLLTAAFVGVSGHMGARTVLLLERYLFPALEARLKRIFGHEKT